MKQLNIVSNPTIKSRTQLFCNLPCVVKYSQGCQKEVTAVLRWLLRVYATATRGNDRGLQDKPIRKLKQVNCTNGSKVMAN